MDIILGLIIEIENIGNNCEIIFKDTQHDILYKGNVLKDISNMYEYINTVCYLEITKKDYLNECNVIEIFNID